jgi:hypothetical protein
LAAGFSLYFPSSVLPVAESADYQLDRDLIGMVSNSNVLSPEKANSLSMLDHDDGEIPVQSSTEGVFSRRPNSQTIST